MATDGTSKILVVYFTYSGQAGRLVDAMTDALTERGCDVIGAARDAGRR